MQHAAPCGISTGLSGAYREFESDLQKETVEIQILVSVEAGWAYVCVVSPNPLSQKYVSSPIVISAPCSRQGTVRSRERFCDVKR
jgi:hypothetical protein